MIRSLLTICAIVFTITISAQVKIEQPLTENLIDPIGIDNNKPRFSWKITSNTPNTLQTAYAIKVSEGKKIIWSTGKVASDQSVLINYDGPSLAANHQYSWQVKIWDNHGKSSAWSNMSTWQMGLLHSSNWKAKWIEGQLAEDSIIRPAHLFRKQFNLSKKISSAVAYITAHGMYEAMINGKRVGDNYLTPGWTSYNKRLQYHAYDVTDLLNTGNNVAGASLASGWYRTSLLWDPHKNIYGSKLGLLFQLHINYSDGTDETIISDESWKSFDKGPIRSSELYEGEVYDANMDNTAWSTVHFDDNKWSPVIVKTFPADNLVTTYNESVKKHEVFKALKLITTPKGEKVIDFGQNLVGWVQLTTKGNKGDSIKIFHAEVLDKEGNFYTTNLRKASQRNIYILNGEKRMYEPHFTFQGFRYIRIEGMNNINLDEFKAVALYSDMRSTGTFTCSDTLINQLQKNILWGQKGNFVDVPTDCPQRDERLGWTGDAQVFSRTAAFNMNVRNFFSKWLKDLAVDQLSDGMVPAVIPSVFGGFIGGSAGWGDASTVIPWDMYMVYGDKQFLEDQYHSMTEWLRFIESRSKNDLWNSGHHFGDWLFYRPNDDVDGKSAITDKFLIAQCFWAHSTQLTINTAKVLNKQDDVTKYTTMLDRIKKAFVAEYLTTKGRMVSGTQTAYVLALQFDMLPEALRKQAAERLVENIKTYEYHLTTGFLGTPYLCHVLSKFGYNNIAYRLLMQDTYPSWLYPVKMGATTIWERWDGQKTDGTFQNPEMNSFNHYAYGAIGDWMYRTVAGIDVIEPGYKKIRIQPQPDTSLNFASASFDSPYGLISSGWERKDGKITVKVMVPCNASAEIILPGIMKTVGSGKHEFSYLADR
jgi:alpha-L-rhamnosidase